MDIFDIVADDISVGQISLRLVETKHLLLYGGLVGYSVNAEHRGQGFARQALQLLMPIAARHGFSTLWITCTPENVASQRTLERAGAVYIETLAIPSDTDLYARGSRFMRRYRLDLTAAR